MSEPTKIFPPTLIAIPFTIDEVVHLFPVLKEKSVGIVYGETWAIANINDDKLNIDVFPKDQYNIPMSKALPQKKEDQLYIRAPKSIDLLDWKDKKTITQFMDITKTIDISLEKSKIINYETGIAISLFEYFDSEGTANYQFVIDNINNKKRLKEIPILNYSEFFPVYFTPTYIIYRRNWKDVWRALDNNLLEAKHPLVSLLNRDTSDSMIAVCDDNMFVSEEQKHALILTYSRALKTDQLYLATWFKDPQFIPIPLDTSVLANGRRLIKSPNCNTISPSGKWVYFATSGGDRLPDEHYLIYLDPALPNGFLPPFKLPLEGDINVASWMTTPEGLVLYKDQKLLYYDLSHFDPKQFINTKQ